jgi:hypothetical protein
MLRISLIILPLIESSLLTRIYLTFFELMTFQRLHLKKSTSEDTLLDMLNRMDQLYISISGTDMKQIIVNNLAKQM